MEKLWRILASACLIACVCAGCNSSGNGGALEGNGTKKTGTGSLIKWRESEALRNADKYAPDSDEADVRAGTDSTATNAQSKNVQ